MTVSVDRRFYRRNKATISNSSVVGRPGCESSNFLSWLISSRHFFISQLFLFNVFLCIFPGLWHSRGAVQRYTISASTRWKHWRNLLHRQRGSVWHLLQDTQAEQSYIRGFKPPGVRDHEWCDYMPAVPRTGRSAVEIAEVCLWISLSATPSYRFKNRKLTPQVLDSRLYDIELSPPIFHAKFVRPFQPGLSGNLVQLKVLLFLSKPIWWLLTLLKCKRKSNWLKLKFKSGLY